MKNINHIKIILVFLVIAFQLYSQNLEINRIEPPNWWSGMKLSTVQFMLYGNNLNNLNVVENLSDLKVSKISKAQSSNYCFVEIEIPQNVKNDSYNIFLTNSSDTVSVAIPIYERRSCPNCFKGFSSDDIIYLITPDRFCDGDLSNDNLDGFVKDYPFKSEMRAARWRYPGDNKSS